MVASSLDDQVQNLAFIIDGSPDVHAPTSDVRGHLVQMPSRRRLGSAALEVARDLGAELDRPAADRLVADLDPALGEQFLDVPKAEREAEVEPYSVADRVSREPMALER